MKRLGTALMVCSVLLLSAHGVGAVSFTTGFTFDLPETFPLHNVYVGVRQNATGFEDLLLPGTPTIDVSGITPPGFDVPVGNSSFDLNSLFGFAADIWAVVGLFTDAGGTDHVVLGTNADLTGVPLSTPLGGVGFLGEAGTIAALATGVGLIAEAGIVETLGLNGFMLPFGATAQLFFFSDGAPIPGAAVIANSFGVPGGPQPIPEPSTLFCLATGLLGLLGYAWRQRKLHG